MQAFHWICEVRKRKKYDTAINATLGQISSSLVTLAMNSLETNQNEGPEVRALTQEEVGEQIKSFIAPPTREVDRGSDWARLKNYNCNASDALRKGRYQG